MIEQNSQLALITSRIMTSQNQGQTHEWTWRTYLAWAGVSGIYGWLKYMELQRAIRIHKNIQNGQFPRPSGEIGIGTSNLFFGQGYISSERDAGVKAPPDPIMWENSLYPECDNVCLQFEGLYSQWTWTSLGVKVLDRTKKSQEEEKQPFFFPETPGLNESVGLKIEVLGSSSTEVIEIDLSKIRLINDNIIQKFNSSLPSIFRTPNPHIDLRPLLMITFEIKDIKVAWDCLAKFLSEFWIRCSQKNSLRLEMQSELIQPEKTVTLICSLRHLNGKTVIDSAKPVIISNLLVPDYLKNLEVRMLGLKRCVWVLTGFVFVGILASAYFKSQVKVRKVQKNAEWKIFETLRTLPQKVYGLIKPKKDFNIQKNPIELEFDERNINVPVLHLRFDK